MVRTRDHEASLLCGILQRPQIYVYPSIPYSLTPSAYVLPRCDRPSSTPTQNRQNYSRVHFNLLTPNVNYRGRTTPLNSKRCILYI